MNVDTKTSNAINVDANAISDDAFYKQRKESIDKNKTIKMAITCKTLPLEYLIKTYDIVSASATGMR